MAKFNKCIDKIALAEIIQAGQSAPGEAAPQTFNGELQGTILTDGGSFNSSNLFGHSSWDQVAHPASNFSIGPLINPACGGEAGNENIGTIVINPNLPANTTASSFDLTIDILDNSAGMGAMFLFCVDTLEIFGSSTAGQNSTTSWDISGAPCPPEDIRVGMTAFGATSSYPVTNCDHINPVVETIVVVTPSECLPALECFETLFGCSLLDMINASSILDGCCETEDDTVTPATLQVTREECPDIIACGTFDPREGFAGAKCGFTVSEGIQANTWQVVFDNPAPNADYGVTYGTEQEITPAPTSVVAQTVSGSKTVNGFLIQATTHDNGAGEDPLTNIAPVSISVCSGEKKSVVTDVKFGDAQNVTGCILMEAFDNDSGLLEAGEFSQLEIKIDGVSTGAPIVHDYTTSYNGSDKSTWYTPWLAAINALPEWSITLVQDTSGNQPAQGKPIWQVDYAGSGSSELKLCKGGAGTTSPEELVITAAANGDLTGEAYTYGGVDLIPSPVFRPCR